MNTNFILKLKNIIYIFLLFSWFITQELRALETLSADDKWLLDRALEVNEIYKKPYNDEPWLKIERFINNKEYIVPRNNHALAHALRKAYLVKAVVYELRNLPSDLAKNNELVAWLKEKSPEEIKKLLKKLELASLYHRAGRENENSRSNGTPFEKERFDRNMRNGAEMFKNAAEKSGIFENQEEIKNYMLPYYRYEFQAKNNFFTGISKFIDELLYATHILDVRRVNASWTDPNQRLNVKSEMMEQVAETLGFGSRDLDFVKKLANLAGNFLAATGDRDNWEGRKTYSDEFFLQAYNPERMIQAIAKEYYKILGSK